MLDPITAKLGIFLIAWAPYLQVCQTMLIGKLPCIQVMMKLRDELTRNVSLALGIAAQKENGGDGHDGLGNVHVESAV